MMPNPVFHPSQPKPYGTVYRFNPVLRRVEWFSWELAAWTPSVMLVVATNARDMSRLLKQQYCCREASSTTYGKTYLEPVVE